MRDHRIRRAPGVQGPSPPRPRAARVPGLRLGRDRAARGRRARVHARRRQPPEPEGTRRHERLAGDDGPRPHALGDPRRRHRGERAPARGGGGREARDRPQRHRRELPRAARAPLGAGPRLLVRDRRRDGDASRRGASTRATSSRRSAARTASSRVTSRSSSSTATTRACSSARGSVPDGRRPRRGRGVPRLQRGGVPRPRRAPSSSRATARSSSSRPRAPGSCCAKDGTAVEHEVVELDWDLEGAEKAGLRDVHAEGDPRAARRGRGDDRRPAPQGPPRPRRARDGRRRAPRAEPDRDPLGRHELPRRRRARATRSRSGRASRSSTTSPPSGSTGTRCSTRTRS